MLPCHALGVQGNVNGADLDGLFAVGVRQAARAPCRWRCWCGQFRECVWLSNMQLRGAHLRLVRQAAARDWLPRQPPSEPGLPRKR